MHLEVFDKPARVDPGTLPGHHQAARHHEHAGPRGARAEARGLSIVPGMVRVRVQPLGRGPT